ncbi:disease resistance protein TAO1-like [Neltuma alba]|uniref:disease resistance protein TAO1-like n=1 Tax=Neltuma alba TaxID=207710 RepID=UPI0010A3798B|nr:disease resistance protein TAO1-like [Prosopis alba]
MNFSRCEFITEVPDMSHFQNLKTLSFRECRNLIKVHDSVGFLCKLIKLDVGKCTQLKSFPSEINMPSLEMLVLTDCKSLDYFPNIVGNTDALGSIFADGSAMKELPNSLFTLQNLSLLMLGGLRSHGRKSLKKLLQESQPFVSCTNLECLDLGNCGLLDEDVYHTLKCFQNLQDLDLSGNHFASLPECIKECDDLMMLEINNCKRLRDIPELPSGLRHIKAENCTALTTESISRLWFQAKTFFTMPATTFPDWFDYCCEGDTLSLGVRGKNFPALVIAIESGKAKAKRSRLTFQVFIRINDRKMSWTNHDVPYALGQSRECDALVFFGKQGQVISFDLLQNYFDEEELEELSKFLELGWNYVDIQVMCDSPNISIIKSGVYVDKQQTSMENIRFVSPRAFMNNASRTSLKRKVISSPLNEPAKKLLRHFKATDKGKLDNTKKGTK